MNVWLNEIWQAWRASLRRPGFLLLAVGILGLGVGASTTVFTLVDHVLLRPLPFPQSGRLVAMGMDVGGDWQPVASPQQYQHLKHLHGVVSTGLVTQGSNAVNILDNGTPQQAQALTADRDLLPTLGIHALIGHNFTAREDLPHGPPVVMLGHGFWERAYGGKSDVLGQQLLVEGTPHTIVGVLPASFDAFCRQFTHGCDIMLPLGLAPDTTDGSGMYLAVARMAPGVTLDAVRAQMDARMQRLVAASKDSYMQDMRFKAMGLHAALHAGRKSTLVLFMGAAFFVLLIACVNLANLLFLRTLARSQDAAIRAALGASALRRKLPVLAESLLVGVAGGLVGIGLAALGIMLFGRFMPAAWLGGGLHVSMAAWVFACVVAVCAALAMTWLALWRMRRLDFNAQLREGGRSGAGIHIGYTSRVLVIAQVALATALLAGAGLFMHALIRASQVQLGFDPTGVVAFDMRPLKTAYPDVQSVSALATRVRQRFDAEPGMLQASVSTSLPAGGYAQTCGFHVGSSPSFCAKLAGVDSTYFATIAVPMVSGRAFSSLDLHGGERVAIVNKAFARKYFGGHALGKTLGADHPQPVSLRIVGVVGDTRHAGPLSPAPPILFVPLQQVSAGWLLGRLTVALRVRGDPATYRKLVHGVMTQVAPMQPIADFQPLTKMVAHKTLDVQLILLLVGVFAILALLLATAGIYAVMAVAVASREHEFGVRTALGASPARLVHLVLRSGMWQIGIGLLAGIGMAVLLSFLMHTVLARIGRNALDPIVLGSVCVLLVVSGLLACLRPALRAAHIAPMRALRGE